VLGADRLLLGQEAPCLLAGSLLSRISCLSARFVHNLTTRSVSREELASEAVQTGCLATKAAVAAPVP